jgi:hypothetical protein
MLTPSCSSQRDSSSSQESFMGALVQVGTAHDQCLRKARDNWPRRAFPAATSSFKNAWDQRRSSVQVV